MIADDEVFWRHRDWWHRAGVTSISVWAGFGLIFLGSLLAARRLGAAGYGEVVLAVSIASFIGLLFDISLVEAVVYYGMRVDEHRLGARRSIVRVALTVNAIVGVVLTALILALAAPIANLAGDGLSPEMVRVASLIVLLGTFDGTTAGVLLLAGRPDLTAASQIPAGLARIVGVLIALRWGGRADVVLAFAVSAGVGSLAQAIAAYRVGWRAWGHGDLVTHQPGVARALLRFGMHTSATTTVTGSTQYLAPIVLGALTDARTLGLFSAALLPITAAQLASTGLRSVLFPEQARLAATRSRGLLLRSVRLYGAVAFGVGAAAAALGWFVLPALIHALYTAKFDAAVPAARIALIAAVAQLTYGWAKSLPAALGVPYVRTIVSIVELTLTIGGIALLARDGARGAMLGVSIAALAMVLVWNVLARLLLGDEGRWLSSRGSADPAESSSEVP